MKRILIILGIVLILAIAGVWGYLFFSGKTSTTDGIFAEFGSGGDASSVDENGAVLPPENVIDTSPRRLRQLSFRPVAGATLTETGVLYVEQGTGHIYHINLASGNETLVSGTTIPETREALFSPLGTYVAMVSYGEGEKKTVVGAISSDGGLEGVSLPEGAEEIAFDEDGEVVYYLLTHESGSRGYSYTIEGARSVELFDIPLRDVRVVWGNNIYVYTTPTSEQFGYLYLVSDNSLMYTTAGRVALMAFGTPGGLVYGNKDGWGYLDDAWLVTPFKTPLLPEKCAAGRDLVICAIPRGDVGADTFPDVWYKGLVSYSDSLFSLNFETGVPVLLSDFLKESGRAVDVADIGTDKTGGRVWFINKNDNTLWLFDATIL